MTVRKNTNPQTHNKRPTRETYTNEIDDIVFIDADQLRC